MKSGLSAGLRRRGAVRALLYGLIAFVAMGATTAAAQSGLAAAASAKAGSQLDAIAGADVREDRSVGLTAAVVKRKETLLLQAYGKSDVEGDVAATVDTVFAIGSDTNRPHLRDRRPRRDAGASRDSIRPRRRPLHPQTAVEAIHEPPLQAARVIGAIGPSHRPSRKSSIPEAAESGPAHAKVNPTLY